MIKFAVHVIARETTNFGRMLFQAMLEDLRASKVVNQLIIVDNGCSPQVRRMMDEQLLEFEANGTKTKVIDCKTREPFNELRNLALRVTDPDVDYFAWFDTDEAFPPDRLKELINLLGVRKDEGIVYNEVRTTFDHFMIDPSRTQYDEDRYNIVRFTSDIQWVKNVHEHIVGFKEKNQAVSDLRYVHFGYCRPQWKKFLHWLRYCKLECGNLNQYKEEIITEQVGEEAIKRVVDHLRDWREPNSILNDRIPKCKVYTGSYTPGTQKWLALWKTSGLDWASWLAQIDSIENEFYGRWKKLKEEKGSWRETLDIALEWYEKENE